MRKKLNIIILLAFFSLSIDAQTWDTVHKGVSPMTGTMGNFISSIIENNSDIYAAGSFTFGITNGAPATGIAKWDGVSWSALGTGISAVGPGAGVSCMAIINSELYAGGAFTNAGGVSANHVAKWNGTSWSALGAGTNGWSVSCLAVYKNNLYAAGNFTTAGGVSTTGIAKWSGSAWSAVGAGLSGISALAVYNGELYIGSSSGLYTWDGTSLSNLSSVTITRFTTHNTELYASGNFSSIGISANIAKWNGVSWSPVATSSSNSIMSLVFYKGELYVGGTFSLQSGVTCNNIAKWNGITWSPLGTGTNDQVQTLQVHNGELYVGGTFYTAGGISVDFIAKWTTPGNVLIASTTSTMAGCSVGNNGSVSVTAIGGVPPYTYLWSTGDTSATVNNLPIGTYGVTVTEGGGNTDTAVACIGHVVGLPSAPSICMVTVDDASMNNVVYWDKTPYPNVDSFIVYRETVSNTFKRIGAVSNDSLSMFTDTVRQLYFPFTGDPNVGGYRYKLQIRDTCGNYSALSLYHNTIYVSQTGSAFSWNQYQIEGQATPIPQLTSYYLLRDNIGTGNWAIVGGVSASQLSINDPNYATYPNGRWRVETQWTISCTPTRSVSATHSNIKGLLSTGITANEFSSSISIFPNPFTSETTILFTREMKNTTVKIVDILGKEIKAINFTGKQLILEKGTIKKGIYFVQISDENQNVLNRKIIIQ